MASRERRFTIGRDKTCDVPIADDSVSRLHAQFSILAGGGTTRDAGPTKDLFGANVEVS
jgi:pSer/pThr/pTyr-binding forkhead associated (FHA) protein